MLSHEPKNCALLRWDGSLILSGVAFRSSRIEPFGRLPPLYTLIDNRYGIAIIYKAGLKSGSRLLAPLFLHGSIASQCDLIRNLT